MTHRKVIEAIHNNYLNGAPFAIHELRELAGVSTSSVVRVLRKLVEFKLLDHSERAYAGRHYRVTMHWNRDVNELVENYEIGRMIEL